MTARSLQDQVDALLSQTTVEDRSQGLQSVDLEAAALIQNFATTLLLNPKVVLYFAMTARNGVLKILGEELESLADLRQTISDLGNATYAIRSTTALEKAKTALLQLENQRVSSVGPAYAGFDRAVSEFLTKQLSRNIRRRGAADLVRPGSEARKDLPAAYEALARLHEKLLGRLYALMVGVGNFQSTPLVSLIGGALSLRAREDIQSILDELEEDNSGTASRDYALRLIGSRAAIRSIVKPPSLSDYALSTTPPLPRGYTVTGKTELLPASVTFGPAELSTSGSLIVSVDGVSETLNMAIPAGPVLVGSQVSWPVEVPANTYLFLWSKDSQGAESSCRVLLNETGASRSLALSDVVAAVQSAGYEAAEFCSGRLVVWKPGSTNLEVISSWWGPKLSQPDVVYDIGPFYDRSAHELLGLSYGTPPSVKTPTSARAQMVVDAISFGLTHVRASMSGNGAITIETAAAAYGTTMGFLGSLADSWGISGPHSPTSSRVFLEGSSADGSTVYPNSLLSPGDVLEASTGSSKILGVTTDSISLETPLVTFSGPIRVTSGLYLAWSEMDTGLRAFVLKWKTSPFMRGLGRLDTMIAVLAGSSSPAQRAQALGLLETLSEWLGEVSSVLSAADSRLLGNWAAVERPIADNLIATLLEKKYDRAADLLLQCKVSEFFDLDYQSMSYGGNLLKASSALGTTDLAFPDRSRDEGFMVTSRNSGAGGGS